MRLFDKVLNKLGIRKPMDRLSVYMINTFSEQICNEIDIGLYRKLCQQVRGRYFLLHESDVVLESHIYINKFFELLCEEIEKLNEK